jgi:hypothetical protein
MWPIKLFGGLPTAGNSKLFTKPVEICLEDISNTLARSYALIFVMSLAIVNCRCYTPGDTRYITLVALTEDARFQPKLFNFGFGTVCDL